MAAALRARAVLLGLVLALAAAVSPAAASVTGLHGHHGLAGDGLTGDHVLELLRETARAETAQTLPEPPERPAFTLWPAPLPENGHLFARAPEPPRLELVVLAPAIASDGAARLAETRIRAFGLFESILHLGSNRVSRETATGYGFGLWGNRVGPTQKGLWTDPVTGMSYARARWYDARNAHWLSEDPLGAVDSTNLYAFVGWQPNMGTDPMGECLGFNDEPCYVVADRWAANLQAKKEELSVGGSGWGSVALNTVTGTAIDAVELFAIDPLRAGASTGEAIGSGGDALDITVAIVEDAGRVAVLAGAAGGTVKTVGRGARGLRRAFTLSDEIGEAVSAGLREGAAEGISELRPRFKEPRIPRRGAQFFDDLARQSTKNPTSAKVVIGKWQEANKSYTKVAAHYRASYFKATNWRELTRTLTADELRKINEAFLDQQIQAGKQIFLSHDPSAATGFFLNEVQYLEDLGYRFVQHNWVWKALR